MSKSEKTDVQLKFNSINELRFSFNLDEIPATETNHEIGFGFGFHADPEKKTLTISAGIALRTKEKVFLECWYSFEFFIIDFDKIIEVVDDKFNCKEDIVPTLLGVSFSTLRGILYTKTLGTKISPLILPIINPEDLIAKQMEQLQK